ncbi:hypothetical protein TanjilG_14280 [Lupinus angustifolius]|uniref:AT-hook motif nuclear-localized protein n=1 Tax=Lupinus angustifolius TaxID=3871 RepID=A0A1J7GI39_LUPAN|nr:hypothetical protein TanjilG_14280 [Lupinus angustifolius]
MPSSAGHGGHSGGGDWSRTPSTETPLKKRVSEVFEHHVILVESGEDIAERVMAYSGQGSRKICILSASGLVSNVILQQTALSGGTATYEIIVGSFVPNGKKSSSNVLKSGPSSAPAPKMFYFGGSMTATSPT